MSIYNNKHTFYKLELWEDLITASTPVFLWHLCLLAKKKKKEVYSLQINDECQTYVKY